MTSEVESCQEAGTAAAMVTINPLQKFHQRMRVSLMRSCSNSSGAVLGGQVGGLEDQDGAQGGQRDSQRITKKSLGLAASARLITRAANWKAKSLLAKTERRERRATKTLAIVLGIQSNLVITVANRNREVK